MPSNQQVALYECDCPCGSCCGRCLPKDCLTGELLICLDPISGLETQLPMTLTCDITATPDIGSTTCFNGSGTLTFLTPLDAGGLCCWEGDITGTCLDCNGVTFNWSLNVVVCCNEAGWSVSGIAGAPCTGPGSVIVAPTSCDPLLLEDCWTDKVVACFVGCLDDITPVPTPQYTLCFSIYETP